jgi:capsular exopolysaccharide synthesis family protein
MAGPVESNAGPNAASDPEFFSFASVLSTLVRRGPVMAAVALATASLVFAIMVMRPPVFTASTLLMVNPGQDRILAPDQAITAAEPDVAFVESELEVLRSPALTARLVSKLELAKWPEFNGALRPPTLQDIVLGPIKRLLKPERDEGPASAEQVADAVADAVGQAVVARRRAPSYALEITASASTAERAVLLANTMADLYLDLQLEARFDTAQRANTWLTTRLEQLRQELQGKESAAETYRARFRLLSAEGSTLTERQTAEAQTAVMVAEADLAEREARLRQLSEVTATGGSADSIAAVTNSAVIRELRAREADISRRQADLEQRYGEMHPSVRNIRAEREDIQSQIRGEVSRISETLRSDVDVARTRLDTLRMNLSQARGALNADNSALVRLREMERDAAATRAVYESFLQRFHEITDQGNLAGPSARVVSRATPPRQPSAPRFGDALLLSLGIGIAMGLAAALLLEAMDNRLRSPEDVERKLGVAAIASVPLLKPSDLNGLPHDERHPAGFLAANPMSAFAESCRVLRTAFLFAGLTKKAQLVAVTSALADEGKTTISLCLARVAALAGQKVIILDCDLRRRSMTDLLQIQNEKGLTQSLLGEVGWRDCIVVDEKSGAHVIPATPTPFTPRDVFGSEPMHKLLAELRADYDLVVLDCAPVLAVAETRVIATQCEALAVVTRADRTNIGAVRAALQQLRASGAPILGIALNGLRPRRFSYGDYRDPYYLRKSQKGYYSG